MFVVHTEDDARRFHIGMDSPPIDATDVTSLFMDGNELRYVINAFENVPYNKENNHLTLVGEMAQNVYANL